MKFCLPPVVASLWVYIVALQLSLSATSPGTGTGSAESQSHSHMTDGEKNELKEEAKEMFYHAYNAYMDNAYPADELMPLSCRGRWRDSEASRGDIDDALGNFSLTLVDTLDTLVILGDLQEFERALKLTIKDVSFNHDIAVSVFETNIRMVGGLISGHILAEHLNQLYGIMGWYRGELLTMAHDLATRLLPAFNTTTGIPHPRVNLKHGLKSSKIQNSRDTCTACAGTIILEFASLSRLTGEPVFEEKARQAMDYLWSQRHRGSDLVGTVLNIHSGDWVRRDSGVGAGIDSYYEYLLKAYVLLGDEGYLERFNKHYNAVMKYVSQGPMLLDVHMHRPHTTSRNFMDALLAFWPGLQVLKGDIKPAIETHEMLYQVIQRHNFLPEAFTTDFQVHWGQHLLRPEFVESTYLLYEATGDHYYLRVGEQVLRALQKHAWVPCGYAAVKDVRTGGHEDRMDSFVLAETFKYLYLLFADPEDLVINLEEFVFTTEAHLLPLTLARLSNLTAVPLRESQEPPPDDDDVEYARSCPNAHFLFPGRHQFAENIRRPLKNFVSNVCPSRKTMKRKLRASEFQAGNKAQMAILNEMGIAIMALPDGRVQLLHTSSNAKSSSDAEEGLLFMQEMIELSKLQQAQPENPPRVVGFERKGKDGTEAVVAIMAGPAQFGVELKDDVQIYGPTVKASPFRACEDLTNVDEIKDHIVILERGDCMFVEKARKIESLGALGGIVVDNNPGSSSATSPMFAMSGDGNDNVHIPLVFLFTEDAKLLLEAVEEEPGLEVVLSDFGSSNGVTGVGSAVEVDPSKDVSGLDDKDVEEKPLETRIKSIMNKHKSNLPSIDDDLISGVKWESYTALPNANGQSELVSSEDTDAEIKVKQVEAATIDAQVLEAALLFVADIQRVRQESLDLQLPPLTPSMVTEFQSYLIKKSAESSSLLWSLWKLHIRDIVGVLEEANLSPKELQACIKYLRESLPSTADGDAGSHQSKQVSRLEDTPDLLKKIKDIKINYERLLSMPVDTLLKEELSRSPSNTKEENKKDEL